MCPYRFIWKCDGDCIGCEYHAAGDITSLDQPLSDGNGTIGDYIPDRSKPMEEVIADRAIARELGRPQKTFADQMKKYRTALYKITGDK